MDISFPHQPTSFGELRGLGNPVFFSLHQITFAQLPRMAIMSILRYHTGDNPDTREPIESNATHALAPAEPLAASGPRRPADKP